MYSKPTDKIMYSKPADKIMYSKPADKIMYSLCSEYNKSLVFVVSSGSGEGEGSRVSSTEGRVGGA